MLAGGDVSVSPMARGVARPPPEAGSDWLTTWHHLQRATEGKHQAICTEFLSLSLSLFLCLSTLPHLLLAENQQLFVLSLVGGLSC